MGELDHPSKRDQAVANRAAEASAQVEAAGATRQRRCPTQGVKRARDPSETQMDSLDALEFVAERDREAMKQAAERERDVGGAED